MNVSQSRESLVFDYRTLRLIIGALAFAFPAMVGALTGKITTSISASYHEAGARDVFVGFLFILGALLVSYKGHRLPVSLKEGSELWVWIRRHEEDCISALAGVAAILAALFPTTCDGCSLDTKARIHTIGAFVLFSSVVYFSLIAFLRSLNKKLQAHDELREIKNTAVPENGGLFRRFIYYLISEILLFRRIVSEVSRKYDEEHPEQSKGEKLAYLLTAYRQKIRRGWIYVICGSAITLVLLAFVPAALVWPHLVAGSKLTFLAETISLWLFGFAWMTAAHVPYLRKIRLLLALRRGKRALVPELGPA